MTDPRSLLLIAGPVGLSDDEATRGDLAGAGAIAAIAAAPIAEVQLWARAGSSFDARLQDLMKRRRIDLGGATFVGDTPSVRDGVVSGGPFLPEIEPVTADGVGAALIVGLVGEELTRAVRVIRALPGGATRPLVIRTEPGEPTAVTLAAAAQADIRIFSTLRSTYCAIDIARSFQGVGDEGPKCVIATADALGGIIAYGQKATTYQTLPELRDDRSPEQTGAAGAAFAGVLAAWLAGKGKADFTAIKRGAMLASAVAGATRLGPPARKLLSLGAKEYHERFNKLRRVAKA